MRRREFLGALGRAAMLWPLTARADQSQVPRRIGLMANLPLPPIQKFRERLQKLGYVEGKNLIIETFTHFTDGSGRDDYYSTDTMAK